MNKLKVLDLFSGIGGFSLGLEATNSFETVAFCEIDNQCQRVLQKHWPSTPIFSDVSALSFCSEESKEVDIICGGFPCQDISVAGKQKGLKGERSGLWFEFKRLIQEINPRYAIIENVANLRGNGLATILKDLWEIGYDAEWHIISACGVGAVHRRERIWILAYPNSERHRRVQSGRRSRQGGEEEVRFRGISEKGITSDTDNLRLWKPFTSTKEKQKWWTETTASFRNVLGEVNEIEPTICRGNDGIPKGLDKSRRERVKQLGNSIVPQIAEWIGNRIVEYERKELL